MVSLRNGWVFGLAMVLGASTALAAPQAILSSHVPDAVARHTLARIGLPDPARELALSISLPMRNQAQLDDTLHQIYNPASPFFHHYLSVKQFTEAFGPSEDDYNRAVKFFSDQGLRVTSTAGNRLLIDVRGKVADIERVFNVTMGMYHHPSGLRDFIAPDREPSLDLDVPMLHVTGLTDFDLPYNHLKIRQGKATHRTTGSGPSGDFIGSDVRAAYYGGTALTGTGQSIGLMELEGYNITDVDSYFTKEGPKLTAAINGISTDGSSLKCSGSCDDSEQVLDIEYAISMAPGVTQVQVYVGANAESVLNRQASDNTSKQISTSWGWGVKEAPTDEPIFKEFAAQGQTNLTASGDDSSLSASGPWPEESDYIVAVGGTDLTTVSAGGAWKSETGWSGSAGGPSLLKTETIESYQLPLITTANGGSKTLRNVPDIAGDADTDNYICADATCTGGYGGTSFASPLWAGFIALANQQAAAKGLAPVGFINPAIYALGAGASYATVFHDETSGKSGKFTAVKGYDLVTGLGSPQAALITSLAP